jgi:hypothetical protein
MTPMQSFTWGALGSILPELLRVYRIVQSPNPAIDLTWWHIVLSVAFVLASGIFTVAFQPDSRWKATWVGISFPVLVSALIALTPAAQLT